MSDMHDTPQQLKDFLANKGDSNAKDALNAYERKWLSDWARRDWSMHKNELVDCLKQAKALPKPSLKVILKRKYNDANLTTRDQPPNSLLPECPILYGREDEMEKLGKALDAGGRVAALVGGAAWGSLTVQVILLINGYNKMWHIALYYGSSQTLKILFETAI
jgi:hypothetical protein